MNLNDFFNALDAHRDRVPLDELRDIMRNVHVCEADLGDAVAFGDNGYRRNLLRRTDAYEVLVLCWSPGQRSPIHDHAQSTCGVRVISGEAVETRFDRDADGFLHPVAVERFPEGSTAGSQDADIHEIANASDRDLVTLHVYSPPLGRMKTYDAPTQARDRSRLPAPPALHPAG